jgi:hypothetical protein
MGFNFGGGTSTTTAQPSQEQLNDIAQSTEFKGKYLLPALAGIINTGLETYNKSAPGVENAAQNLASQGSQAQQTFGGVGESALRTGVTGMESLFSPDYEAKQIAAALQPAQAQYLQNVANQEAQFGGTGELGSARQALAGRQLAGSTMATQAATAAQVEKDIAAQRAANYANLGNLGTTNISNAVTAAGVPLTAAQTGTDYINKLMSAFSGVPAGTYTPNFQGTQGSSTSGNKFQISI